MENGTTMLGAGGLIPAGRYLARALPETAKFGKAGTGIQQIVMSFVLLDGPYKGTKLPWFGFLNENTEVRTLESLVYAGCTFPNDDFADLTGLGTKDVDATVELSEHPETGDPQCRIAWINEPGAVFLKEEHSEDDRKVLAKAVKPNLVNVKKRLGLKKPTTTKDTASKDNNSSAAAK